MPKKIIFLLTLCFALDIRPSCAQMNYKVIEEQETDGLASYVVVVPADEFRKDDLLRLANEYLRRYGKLKLLNVGIYTDSATADDSAGKKMFDFTYGVWMSEFETRKQNNSMCAAELLKYGGAATLRIRYSDGRIEEVAITDGNVFHPAVNGMALNLLHVSFARQGFGNAKQLIPHFYFRVSKKLTAQEAGIIAKSILRTSGASKLEVHLRQDEWFIFDAYYPWMNPFSQTDAPPTETEAAQSVEYLCKPAEEQACYQSSVGARQ
jgi:hypothetical protein